MKNDKAFSTPLASYMKLSKKMCPIAREEKDSMDKVPDSSVVETLMYAMVCTRPDIAQAVGVVGKFLDNLRKELWEGVKWILRTKVISWRSKLPKRVALSKTEVEYIAATEGGKEMIGSSDFFKNLDCNK
ncbi:hypothetical protein KY290_005182 [Solanum tuberosum]|uniref:Uncharacterized protein n=1 Tax=Solanum tuberosum TaxID=4113 RepID=A0ABQ7WFH8_SOLTU|nr:hypothetical protein KY290_005182 [Solanum tuberosum]